MKNKLLIGLTTAFFLIGMVGLANAVPVTFFGEDLNNYERTNADAAHDEFMANLSGVGTEDFEGFADGTPAPIALDFGLAGTATLSGPGAIQEGPNVGRWATSGSRYWETNEDFTISFSESISAFGFYGTDIGDFGGELTINYVNGASNTLSVGNSTGQGNFEGTVLYYGFYEDDPLYAFNSIEFGNTTGSDWFDFDDMTIGTYEQVTPEPVPEPATIMLMGIGLLSLMSYSRKRFNKKV